MRLLRHGDAGREKPGLLDHEGLIRDLSGVIPDVSGDTLLPESLARIRQTPGNGRVGRPGMALRTTAIACGAASAAALLTGQAPPS